MKYLFIFLLLLTSGYAQTYYQNTDDNSEVCSASDAGMNTVMWSCGANTTVFLSYSHLIPAKGNAKEMYAYTDGVSTLAVTPDHMIAVYRNSSGYVTSYIRKNVQVRIQPQLQECDYMDRDMITGRCPTVVYPTPTKDIASCLRQADEALRSADMMGNSVSATMLRQRALQYKSDCYN